MKTLVQRIQIGAAIVGALMFFATGAVWQFVPIILALVVMEGIQRFYH